VWERSLLQMLAEAGFAEPTFHGWTGYFTSPYTQGGLITAWKPGGETAPIRYGAKRKSKGDSRSAWPVP
jgi:hypothetical protein